MKRILRALTEDTTISLGLMVIVVALTIWLDNVATEAHEAKRLSDAYLQQMGQINERLARIEGKLDDLKGR